MRLGGCKLVFNVMFPIEQTDVFHMPKFWKYDAGFKHIKAIEESKTHIEILPKYLFYTIQIS